MTIVRLIHRLALTLLAGTGLIYSAVAQEVSIPDPGLNAAIRETLQKPNGTLTRQDLLGLTVLHAGSRNIGNLQGLEAASNLLSLDLRDNQFSSLQLPEGMPRLSFLDLRANMECPHTVPSVKHL